MKCYQSSSNNYTTIYYNYNTFYIIRIIFKTLLFKLKVSTYNDIEIPMGQYSYFLKVFINKLIIIIL